MNRISETFGKGPAFVGYLTAGDGDTVQAAEALIAGGVNCLEIGVPFSDPMADGPVIQKAMGRALQGGTTPYTALKIARKLREESEVPLILFSYINPLLAVGYDYLQQAKDAGFDGVLVVDLPIEEDELCAQLKEVELAQIYLATPSTSKERLRLLAQRGQAFVYYVTQKGTTGVRQCLPLDFVDQIRRLRDATELPVAAGFGIGTREMAQAVLEHADGFIVGSKFVDALERASSPAELTALAKGLDPR